MKKKMKEPRKTSKKALMDEGSSYLPFNRLIEHTWIIAFKQFFLS